MKRRIVRWVWEDPEAQHVFAEWLGFYDRSQTAKQVDRIETILGVHLLPRVMDIGYGTGRHAIEMTQRGYDVVGIDKERFCAAELPGRLGWHARDTILVQHLCVP